MTDQQTSSEKLGQFRPYDLFVALLSVLSIINIVLFFVFSSKSILYVIGTIDLFLSLIFFIDFIQRLTRSSSKLNYLFHELGWADLLSSIPFPQFKILRIFRIVKAYRLIRQLGPRQIGHGFFRNRASSALYLILFIIILLLEFGSIAILTAEKSNPAANINTASDAIWWVYVTITTVGYGDKYPITNAGRSIGMLVMFVGVGLFGVLTGFLANKFLPTEAEVQSSNPELQKIQADIADIKSMLSRK